MTKEYKDTPRTRRREVIGTRSDGYKLVNVPIDVRYTSDETGKGLSLTAYMGGEPVQLYVPLEPLAGMIEGVD